jgi:hypothetical protein
VTWLKWFFVAVSAIIVLVLGNALRTGTLISHKGPDIRRSEHPTAFWVVFVSYVAILGVAVLAAIRW